MWVISGRDLGQDLAVTVAAISRPRISAGDQLGVVKSVRPVYLALGFKPSRQVVRLNKAPDVDAVTTWGLRWGRRWGLFRRRNDATADWTRPGQQRCAWDDRRAGDGAVTTQVHAGTGGSPHVKTEWTIDGALVSIESRPPLGSGAGRRRSSSPAGQPWRTGADEPTLLTTNKPLEVRCAHLGTGTTHHQHHSRRRWVASAGRQARAGPMGVPYRTDLETGRAPMQLGKAGGC